MPLLPFDDEGQPASAAPVAPPKRSLMAFAQPARPDPGLAPTLGLDHPTSYDVTGEILQAVRGRVIKAP